MQKYLLFFIILFTTLQAEENISEQYEESEGWTQVAVIGDSRSEQGEPSGINENVLGKLLDLIKQQDVKAVFSTGDLILGLRPRKVDGNGKDDQIVPGPEKDIYGNRWAKKGFVYSSDSFRSQLQEFLRLYKEKLGTTPIFPLVGYDEALGPDSIQIFKDVFGITNAKMIGPYLVYSIRVGNACFVMLSTDYYDVTQKRIKEHYVSIAVLEWLSNELKEKAKTCPFLFVLGHEPAFSTTGPSGEYRGLDQEPFFRDIFWHILEDNHVVAYLSSHEHLYDRSDRQGVWQIISGGAGAPLTKRNLEKAFYHFLLLSIPTDSEQNPVIDVLDVNGKIRDSFELKTKRTPIYQLRIS